MAAKPATDTEQQTLLSDGQRIVVAGLFAAGLTFLAVGALVSPRDALFWVAFLLGPPFMGCIGAILAIAPGRRLDAWLLAGGRPDQAAPPAAAAALPEPAREALLIAATPALLAELARASAGMAAPEKAAAGRLLQGAAAAWNAARDTAARGAVARALPGLVAALRAGGPEAVRAAQDAAARFETQAGVAP